MVLNDETYVIYINLINIKRSEKMKETENGVLIISKLIETHRENAYRKVNEELVTMYYEIGAYLSNKISNEKWGSKVIENIAKEISIKYPELHGFNKRGLYRMIQFYETYKDSEFVSPLVTQISWSNNMLIFSHESTLEEKEFYIRMCIKNNYSKRELQRQIASHYYERYIISGKASESVLPVMGDDDYPNTRLLDVYTLEFLDLPNHYLEKDLQNAILNNLKDFILEIGKDFSFVGKEYKVTVGDNDYFIDLLFYNRTYSCLVAFELKLGEFIPEYISKMDFYLEALDRFVKKENENPSVGIILCTKKSNTVVEFSLSRTISPTMVSTYETNLIDREKLQKRLMEYERIYESKGKSKA